MQLPDTSLIKVLWICLHPEELFLTLAWCLCTVRPWLLALAWLLALPGSPPWQSLTLTPVYVNHQHTGLSIIALVCQDKEGGKDQDLDQQIRCVLMAVHTWLVRDGVCLYILDGVWCTSVTLCFAVGSRKYFLSCHFLSVCVSRGYKVVQIKKHMSNMSDI